MANAVSDDCYSDGSEQFTDSSEDAESEDSNYEVKKPHNSSSRSKSKSKKVKKKSKGGRRGRKKASKIEEDMSDDSLSQMSDINPPSVATRAKKKKRTRSSTSSNGSSGVRKTKSEPLLITIDSDSEFDNESTISNRPNRFARVQGEMLRKYGSMTDRNRTGYSSSSSASNTNCRTKPLSENRPKRKHLLTLKKRAKLYVLPLNQKRRLKIQNIHKRIAKTDLGKYPQRKQSSKQGSVKSEKTKNESNKKYEEDPDFPEQPPAPRKLGRPKKKKRQHWSCKVDDDIKKSESIDDDIRRIATAAKTDGIEGDVHNKERRLSDGKVSDGDRSSKGDDGELILKEESNEAYSNIISDIEKIKNNERISEDSEEEIKSKVHSKPKKSHKKKISFKPPVNVIRRRGRPRLSESLKKPVVSETTPQVPFLQNSFCFDVAPQLSKCRECRIAVYRNSKRMYNSYCRFMEYRKLCYTKQDVILSAGFSNPTDASPEHMQQWLPNPKDRPKDLDMETAMSLLEHCGDQFCDLITQEQDAEKLYIGSKQKMTWKRIVQGVREMCDVCSTTIFNIHWVCPICGFAVCIDCYKVRLQGVVAEVDEEDRCPTIRDKFKWLLCYANRNPHSQDSLVMAQMIPGNALEVMRDLLHKAMKMLDIPSYCKCNPKPIVSSDERSPFGVPKQLISCITPSFYTEQNYGASLEKSAIMTESSYDELDVEADSPALRYRREANSKNLDANNNLKLEDDNKYDEFYEDINGLGNDLTQEAPENGCEYRSYSVDEVNSMVIEVHHEHRDKVLDFADRFPKPNIGRDSVFERIYVKCESELVFPAVPHSWFCEGRLLFLHQANHEDNMPLFQEQWKRGQPIVVQGVDKRLNMNLWRPESFCKDFGEVKNDLVDCKTGTILKNMPMKKFWEGFENFSKRLTDDNGEYMLLKLKDWPPGEDFSEKLPTRFNDLMKGLPLPEYTHRNGILNLAGRLPLSFVRPDLGPKMYNAYGSALFPQKGTTNLHLDICDAVNVMVYVGIPYDGKSEEHITQALNAISEGGCDTIMIQRVMNRATKPGALWHIYNARDSDKIRDMLTKVAIERGEKLEANHDPIHDQSWYIDSELRTRLFNEYGVKGYAIAQCLGDAVFIPAGAPHQVRNLHSCVKVAEDFVSPENIGHCFNLTQEFRNLSDTHTNHEDKLQIKNIIYHVVKDALSHLLPPDEPISLLPS